MSSEDGWKYLLGGVLFWGTFYGILGGGFTSKFFTSFIYGTMWALPFLVLVAIAKVFGLFDKGKDKK